MIEKSLTLLNTDHVGLWQSHDIGLPEDMNAVFAKGGAREALLQMQEQKVVRFLGVTGHYRPEAWIDAVNRHHFDKILMVLNEVDMHIHSFTDQLLPLAVEKQMGIIGMNVFSRGRLLSSWTSPPLEPQQHAWEGSAVATRPGVMSMRDAKQFTFSHPVSTVIVDCDNIAQLEEKLRIARDFTSPLAISNGGAEQTCGPGRETVPVFPIYRPQRGLIQVDLLPNRTSRHLPGRIAYGQVALRVCL